MAIKKNYYDTFKTNGFINNSLVYGWRKSILALKAD